ncbi:MAG: hypothetical protein FJX77_10420, partial [Armatimonadetes bacterium]|nr:hypothetical protein [Armatimonadota bacterium]
MFGASGMGRIPLSLLPVLVGSCLCLLFPAPAGADLDEYLKRPEPAYKWEKRGEEVVDGCTVYDLHVVSQTWQEHVWEHRVQLFKPEKLDHPQFCTVYNTGGNGSPANTALGIRMAQETGALFAIVFGVPKQPLYNGLTEDALVVYTWLKYLETGDESWPLHFPMAKAVLKSMDAIQAFAKEAGMPAVQEFIVSGASKRGWTTWLCGASRDRRIKGIVPMVIDVLNVRKQAAHQKNSYGAFSEQVSDYTRVNMVEKLETPAGRRLMELEDPYSYRSRLTLPKLLILGTNDPYWTQDALNLYWDDLKGLKWVLYAPNSGHGLDDRDRVVATWSAFVRMIAGKGSWPRLRWDYTETSQGTELQIVSDTPPLEARLFHVAAGTRDFRKSRWAFQPMYQFGTRYLKQWQRPTEGFNAVFGEAVFELGGKPFTLSTQIQVLGPLVQRPEEIARKAAEDARR